MNFNFGEVLTKAWQITWKYKVLWIFGILAGCSQGNGGNFNSNYSGNQGSGDFPHLPPDIARLFEQIGQNLIAFIAICVTVFCILWLVMIFLGTMGRIGLIRGAAQADGGAEQLTFGQLWRESLPYFWRMVGLSLLVAIPVFLLVFVPLAAGMYFLFSAAAGDSSTPLTVLSMLPFLLGCMCLLIPVMWVIQIIIRQSENAIALEDLGIMPALSRGWEVFKANLGPIFLMSIILAVIGFMAGIVIAIPILAVVFPAIFAFALGNAESWTPLIVAGACILIYIPVSWVANGILATYSQSAWTLTYLRLTAKPETPVVIPEAHA